MKWLIFSNVLLLLGFEVFPKPLEEILFVDVVVDSTSVRPIIEEFKDVLALIPRDKITEVAEEHLETDEGFKAAIQYMQSDEWVNLVETVRAKPEWIAFKAYLKEFGFNIDQVIRCAESFVQNVNVTVPDGATKSLTAFIVDVQKSIPLTKIIGAFHDKMMKSQAFQAFFDKISSKESKKIVEDVINLPEIKQMMNGWKDMGLDFYELLNLMYIFLGWGEFEVPK